MGLDLRLTCERGVRGMLWCRDRLLAVAIVRSWFNRRAHGSFLCFSVAQLVQIGPMYFVIGFMPIVQASNIACCLWCFFCMRLEPAPR